MGGWVGKLQFICEVLYHAINSVNLLRLAILRHSCGKHKGKTKRIARPKQLAIDGPSPAHRT